MGNVKVCPKCKTENPTAASFCRHCRFEFPEATKEGLDVNPQIISFKLIERNYTIGSIVHFEWEVENAKIIDFGENAVPAKGSAAIRVEKADFVILTAENDYGKVTRNIRLIPKPQPSIRSFSTAQAQARAGQDVKLKWDTKNCVKLKLSYLDGEIDVTNRSYCKVPLMHSDTFTLTGYAEDENVFVEQSIRINVIAPVRIVNFQSDKDVVVESDKVILTWEIENATSVLLYPLMKDVTRLLRYEVNPSRTTEYRLQATNSISKEELTISVGVRQLPKVDVAFAESFSKIDMPSCDVNLSFLSGSLKNARIDEWMTTKPIEDIKLSVMYNRVKMLYNNTLGKLNFRTWIKTLHY